jgi:tRNA U38,U39,U40 pseudouridine synthase TruA
MYAHRETKETQVTAIATEKHVMHVLDATGDTKVMWSPDNPDEVANAKKTFDELVGKKKFTAYTVKENGDPDTVVREFDKTAGRMILRPQLVGG